MPGKGSSSTWACVSTTAMILPPRLPPGSGGSVRVGPHQTRVKASWAEGFKLPSFFALGEPNVGNPDLKPEKSRGFRCRNRTTFRKRQRKSVADLLPQPVYGSDRLQSRTVPPRQPLAGTDSGARSRGPGRLTGSVQIAGHLTYVDFEIEGSDEPLRDRPRWRGGVRLDWRFHRRAQLHFDNSWVGARYDFQIPVPEQDQVGGYALTALAVSYRPVEDLTLFARIDNLLDRQFHHFVGFPDPGIYARFGLRYRFRFH